MTCEINGVIPKDRNSIVVGETSTDKSINTLIQKVEKNDESSKVPKIKNEETNKTENNNSTKINKSKTINIISSKVDKQVFFDVIDKIKDEETQRNYLKNLKNLILTENLNKTQEIRLTQYSMDEIFNRIKKIQKPITIEDLKDEIQEIKKRK